MVDLDLPTSLLVNGASGLALGASLAMAQRVLPWWQNKWWVMVGVWTLWAITISVASIHSLDHTYHGRRVANACVLLWIVYLIYKNERSCPKVSSEHS